MGGILQTRKHLFTNKDHGYQHVGGEKGKHGGKQGGLACARLQPGSAQFGFPSGASSWWPGPESPAAGGGFGDPCGMGGSSAWPRSHPRSQQLLISCFSQRLHLPTSGVPVLATSHRCHVRGDHPQQGVLELNRFRWEHEDGQSPPRLCSPRC